MFIAVYRWKVKPGMEEQFREGWRRGTVAIRRMHNSFGSRLHRTAEGDFVGYAQWPTRAKWQAVYDAHFPHDDKEASVMFRDAIEISHGPELLMEVTDDLLDLVRG
jgi:hypothetical protein